MFSQVFGVADFKIDPDRLQDGPVRLRGRRVTSSPVPATAAKRRCEDDLRRKGARKDEQMRSLERGVSSTDGMEGLHRLQQGR